MILSDAEMFRDVAELFVWLFLIALVSVPFAKVICIWAEFIFSRGKKKKKDDEEDE